MTQTLELPVDVYQKLAAGAAERGMTITSLLEAVSDLVAAPAGPKASDRARSDRIEKLLQRLREGNLTENDRNELDQLIECDYATANARADEMIAAKKRRSGNGNPTDRKSSRAGRSGKRSRK